MTPVDGVPSELPPLLLAAADESAVEDDDDDELAEDGATITVDVERGASVVSVSVAVDADLEEVVERRAMVVEVLSVVELVVDTEDDVEEVEGALLVVGVSDVVTGTDDDELVGVVATDDALVSGVTADELLESGALTARAVTSHVLAQGLQKRVRRVIELHEELEAFKRPLDAG